MLLFSVLCFNLVFIFGFSSAQGDIGCFVSGKCLNSDSVGISFPIDENACLQDCKDNADCLYFTYEFEDDLCTQLATCDDLETTSASESVSGNVNCVIKNDGSQHTPLDDYVFSAESLLEFRWEHVEENDWNATSEDTNVPYTAHVLNMTSGYWRTKEEVGIRTHWWHIYIILIPENLNPDTDSHGVIWIGSRSNEQDDGSGMPSHDDKYIRNMAKWATGIGMVVGICFQVPNQPIVFADDPMQMRRSEDEIVAYTWQEYLLNLERPELHSYFGQARAGVRAMDAMTQFMEEKYDTNVDRFTITGMSKRGWTSWLTGAMDQVRVEAIIPMVWDAINLQAVFHNQWQSFGGWSFSVVDYVDNNILPYMDTPEITHLQNLIDPYFYRTRLTMPKLVITGLMDEFQMADDEQYWWDEMPSGPTGQGLSDGNTKWLLKSPNSDHSQETALDVILPVGALWISYILNGWDIPYLTWEYDDVNGDVTAWAHGGEVVEAVMWYSTTCDDTRRDFRALTLDDPCDPCGYVGGEEPEGPICVNVATLWDPQPLTANPDGSYTGHMDPPTDGKWGAFVITIQIATEHTKNSDDPKHNFYTRGQCDGNPDPKSGWPVTPPGVFEFTSRASVVPNTFPYDDCTQDGCIGPLV